MWGLDRFTDGLGTSAVVLVAALGGFNSIYNCSLTEDPCAVYFYGESGRVVDFSSLMHRLGNMHLSILFVYISSHVIAFTKGNERFLNSHLNLDEM